MATLDTDAIARSGAHAPRAGSLAAQPERAVLALGLGAVAFIIAFRFVFKDLVL